MIKNSLFPYHGPKKSNDPYPYFYDVPPAVYSKLQLLEKENKELKEENKKLKEGLRNITDWEDYFGINLRGE